MGCVAQRFHQKVIYNEEYFIVHLELGQKLGTLVPITLQMLINQFSDYVTHFRQAYFTTYFIHLHVLVNKLFVGVVHQLTQK